MRNIPGTAALRAQLNKSKDSQSVSVYLLYWLYDDKVLERFFLFAFLDFHYWCVEIDKGHHKGVKTYSELNQVYKKSSHYLIFLSNMELIQFPTSKTLYCSQYNKISKAS